MIYSYMWYRFKRDNHSSESFKTFEPATGFGSKVKIIVWSIGIHMIFLVQFGINKHE